uniref:Uncharacterized protein n=1 Tax=Aegilops tauschii subsp. strangulata TaxID=200361 RepID=A0A453T5D5_AEGTS
GCSRTYHPASLLLSQRKVNMIAANMQRQKDSETYLNMTTSFVVVMFRGPSFGPQISNQG